MRTLQRFLGGITACALSACATGVPPPDWATFTHVVYRGVVGEREDWPAYSGLEPSKGLYLPGMNGAAASAIGSLKPRPGAQPGYWVYTLRSKNESDGVRVAYAGDIEVGTCVEVLTNDPKARSRVYNYGLAVLRPAIGCQ